MQPNFEFRVQKKDNLISVRMAYLSLPYDKPNLPNRQLYTHVAIATSAVMTTKGLNVAPPQRRSITAEIGHFQLSYCIHDVKEALCSMLLVP